MCIHKLYINNCKNVKDQKQNFGTHKVFILPLYLFLRIYNKLMRLSLLRYSNSNNTYFLYYRFYCYYP